MKVYKMTEKVWLYPSDFASWHFVTLTKKYGQEIRETLGKSRRGFGSIPVEVTIGATTWKTSIFPDKHSDSYILPLKAAVRKKEDIDAGAQVTFSIICYTGEVISKTNNMAKGRDMKKEVKKPKKDKDKDKK